jgi:hypothetical protein
MPKVSFVSKQSSMTCSMTASFWVLQPQLMHNHLDMKHAVTLQVALVCHACSCRTAIPPRMSCLLCKRATAVTWCSMHC